MKQSTLVIIIVLLLLIALYIETFYIGPNSFIYSKGRGDKNEPSDILMARIRWLADSKEKHGNIISRTYIIAFITSAILYYTLKLSLRRFIFCLIIVSFSLYFGNNYFNHHSNCFFSYYTKQNLYYINPHLAKIKFKVLDNVPNYIDINFGNSLY